MSTFKRRAAVAIDASNHAPLIKSGSDPENPYAALARLQLNRPVSLKQVMRDTHFTRAEIKTLYRAFKDTSPTALIERDTVREVFIDVFPHGDTEHYADLIFNTFDIEQNGVITFHEFVKTLSILCKGSLEEKLEWIYKLYDPTNSGVISWERLFYIITAIDDLIGMKAKPRFTREQRAQRADDIFIKFDPNNTGVITKQQFLDTCRNDPSIYESIFALHTILPK